MSTHGPIEAAAVAQMNAFAEVLRDMLPPEFGFTLLVFKTGDVEGGRMNYISSAERGDMLTAMKELIANFEGRVIGGTNHKQ